jgi:hypothetical protein
MNWKTVSTLITMVVIAGCQENVASPSAKSSSAPAAMSLAPQDRPQLQLNGGNSNNESTDFTVGPKGGVFRIGNHAVIFPAQSICEPATSGYGLSTWDDSCTPLRGSIRIHAETRTLNGHSWVDFSPSLRFVPSDNPARWVWMYMYVPGASALGDLSQVNILYAPVIGGPAYDESLSDPTMRTYVGSGIAVRRIKHFSGYAVVTRCEDASGCGAPEIAPAALLAPVIAP